MRKPEATCSVLRVRSSTPKYCLPFYDVGILDAALGWDMASLSAEKQGGEAAASAEDQHGPENGQATEGEQEIAPVPGANLYVRNFSDQLTDEGLKSLFAPFGTITSAVVMTKNGASRGFGFVNFSKPEEAVKALQAMNKRLIDQKPLFVSLAQKKEERREFLAQERVRYQRYGTGGGVSPSTTSQPNSQVSTPPRASPIALEAPHHPATNPYVNSGHVPQTVLPQPQPQPRLPSMSPPQLFGGMKKFMLLPPPAGKTVQTGYIFAPAPPLMPTPVQAVYMPGMAAHLHTAMYPAQQNRAGQSVAGVLHPHLRPVAANPASSFTAVRPLHFSQNSHNILLAHPYGTVGPFWSHSH